MKVGDRVRIKRDLKVDEKYDGIYFHNGMKKYCGKETTIYSTQEYRGRPDVFNLKIDIIGHYWSEGMVEKI